MNKSAVVFAMVLLSVATGRADIFTVTNVNDLGPGSLHDAILEANTMPGPDEIHFNIPGAVVHKIYVNQHGLPEITDPLTIDGYTQPGASPNTRVVGNDAIILIQIDGQQDWSGPVNGMVISGGNCIVRGLSITGIPSRVYGGFPEDPPPPPPEGDAIQLKTNGGNVIEGNFIGVGPNGETSGYTYRGVEVLSSGNRIGGTSQGSRNVISRQQLSIVSSGSGTVIEGNYLGSDATGLTAPGNGQGILVWGDDVRIGGTITGAGNLITGSQTNVQVTSIARGTIIQGNLIGTKADGTGNLGPISKAITIYGPETLVGGLEPGAGNRIAFAIHGIRVVGNNAVGNTFFSNVFNAGYDYGPQIELFGFGRNDLGDADTGPNNLQNFPVITSVIHSPESTRIIGGLNSVPSSTFTLQFFVNRHSSMGDALLGTRFVTTDRLGMARFDLTFPGDTAPNEFISATATDADGNTSQFFPDNGRVQLANISTRGKVGTSEEVLIGGFVIHRPRWFNGDYHKRLLIRALGPSLGGAGLPFGDCLADPYLEVYDGSGTLIAHNNNWRSDQAQQIIDTGAPPANDLEAAAVVSLMDAGYTVHVRGANGETGLGIVEVFDLDPMDPINAEESGRLVNISTRGHVGSSDDVLIGGFIVNGDAGQEVVVRAVGPDLAAVGVSDALSDPILEMRNGSGTLLAFNDNWRDTQEQDIQQTSFAPNDNRDSAILGTLIPGNYTAIVRGSNNSTGVAIVEVFVVGQ